MLLSHIVHLHARELPVFQTLFKCLARMVRVHMYLDHAVAGDKYQAVTEPEEEFLHLLLVLVGKVLLQLHDELGAVAELDLVRADRLLHLGNLDWRGLEIKLQLQPVEGVDRTVEDCHEAGAAGINHVRLLEDGQQLRGHRKGLVAGP